MSTFKLAIIYLFWIVIVALTINVFNVYSNIEKPTLSFLDWSTYEKFLAPEIEGSQESTDQDYTYVKSASINTLSIGFGEIKAGYFFKNLGHFLVPFLLMMMVIPPIFFLMKKNVNKALKRRFSVLMIWGLGLITSIYLVEQNELVNGGEVGSSLKLVFAFLSFLCFSYALWLLFRVYNSHSSSTPKEYIKPLRNILNYFAPILFCLLMVETVLQFMDIAVLFPTSPKMGGYWFSPHITEGVVNSGIMSLFTQEVSLMFIQRLFTYTVLAFILVMWYKSRSLPNRSKTKKSIKLLTSLIFFQIILGIISTFLLEFAFVGLLHHIASICMLGVTIHLVAISNNQGVNLKFVNTKIELNRFSFDFPVVEE